MRPRVLVTGAAGGVGRVVTAGLADRYEVRVLDRRRVPGLPGRRADATRLRSVLPAFRDVDAVIDLAADPRLDAPWRDVYRNNFPAAWNALEAARLAGVRRFVFASSNAVTGGYERDEPWASVLAGRYEGLDPATLPRIGTAAPPRPSGPYALSKVFGEAACRHHVDRYGLSAVAVRIGTVLRDDRPKNARHFSTLLSHRDLVALMTCCIEAPAELGWALVYGVSANTWRIWDLTDAQRLLGFAPADDAERWR